VPQKVKNFDCSAVSISKESIFYITLTSFSPTPLYHSESTSQIETYPASYWQISSGSAAELQAQIYLPF
jgi:hypothetical protein